MRTDPPRTTVPCTAAAGRLEAEQVRDDVRPHRRRLRPPEHGDDRRLAPSLADARRRPRARGSGQPAYSMSRLAPAIWRSSSCGASPRGARCSAATSPRRCSCAREKRPLPWPARPLPWPAQLPQRTPRTRGSWRHDSSGRCPRVAICGRLVRRRDRRLRRSQLRRPHRGLAEMSRVVRPGGRVVVLEMTTPTRAATVDLLPALVRPARACARPDGGIDRDAGRASARLQLERNDRRRIRLSARLGQALPRPRCLAAEMERAGLTDISYLLTAGGIIAIHAGMVPAERLS